MFEDQYYDDDYDVINCALSNENNGKTTAFIPAQFASVGKNILINGEPFRVECILGKPVLYRTAARRMAGSIRKAGYGTQNLDFLKSQF